MKRKATGAAFIIVLLFSAMGLMHANLATALIDHKYLPELTIKSDGSIMVCQVLPPHEEVQAPDLINRTGNVYTLTADVEGYSVRIECSNILFDGAGHTIYASPAFANSGLRLIGVTDVVVKNLEVIGDMYVSIFLVGADCLITSVKTDALRVNSEGFNTITESNITKLTLWRGNNLVSKCNIASIFLMDWSGSNVFTQNNFLFNNSTDGAPVETCSANFWDNGSMGNYWSDYLSKYPNATEVSNTGIGDTPYVIDEDNVDYYPLMHPYDIENDAIALPTPEPESFPTALVTTASAASAIAGVALLIYFKNRKHSTESSKV